MKLHKDSKKIKKYPFNFEKGGIYVKLTEFDNLTVAQTR